MKRSFQFVAIIAGVLLCACGEHRDPAPTIALAEHIRGTMQLERAGHTEVVRRPSRVEESATVTTRADARGVVTLDSGAWILFDRETRAVAHLDRLELSTGRVWVDASSADATAIATPHGTFSSANAGFAVHVNDAETEIYCAAGEVTYQTPHGEGRLAQGETLRTSADASPRVSPAASWNDWTGGLADPARNRFRHVERVGVLAGRTLADLGKPRLPLPIRAHEVRTEIHNDLAMTEIVQTFFNARSDSLEAEWAMLLPRNAIVQSFAVDTGNGFEESNVGPAHLSSGYHIAWAPRETYGSKLTWDGPERVRARVYPVAPGATVSIRIRYTEWLDRHGARRTYVYPMRALGEPPLLGEFSLTIDTRDAGAGALRAGMGAVSEDGRVVLRRSDFRPYADFYLDLEDPEGMNATPTEGAMYRVGSPTVRGAEGEHDYVLVDLPTESLASEAEGGPPLSLVLLLDVSGSTDPEDLEITRGVVATILEQLAPNDRAILRIADVHARVPEGASEDFVSIDAEASVRMLESLSRIEPGGATDLGASLRDAASLLAGVPRGAVLYLGDALPTTGALDATTLRATLANLDDPPRFFGFAIGDGANIDLLRALFGEQATAVRDREGAVRAVMHLLADAARPMLRGLHVELGEGIERIYPSGPLTIAHGEHVRLVGRSVDTLPEVAVVRGMRDGEAFERSIPLRVSAIEDAGDVRRRWATARLRELLDEDAGREAMVELGLRFGLVTPWTSLVIGAAPNQPVPLISNFDHDPLSIAWGMGGGGASIERLDGELGWRRRSRSNDVSAQSVSPEATWASRVDESPIPPTRSSLASSEEAGLGRAAVDRAMRTGERGPRQCYERRTLLRPDLSGSVSVRVAVQGDGTVREATIVSSTLRDSDTEQCITSEIHGLRFPAHGGAEITVTHTFTFMVPERELGARRQCGDASREALETRRALWDERLSQSSAGVPGMLAVWREARAQCELGTWRARRALLDLILARLPNIRGRVELYHALGADASIASYLRREILRAVRTPEDVTIVRAGLGLDVPIDWSLFSRLWWQNEGAEARLRLVRRWLAVAPSEMDLRLRLLMLLEETGAGVEARRVARELRADPLADLRVRTAVGEFWLRQGDEAEAIRVFSEIVEHAPFDPWARRRLGDLYRAHRYSHEGYREYETLARLRPGDGEALLLMARAAADAGRIDEALRLEQRLSETAEAEIDEGIASVARLWSTVRLARLELDAQDDDMRAVLRRRWRETGVLRDPPDLIAILTWPHPDDAPRLFARLPDAESADAFSEATLGASSHGIVALRVQEAEGGDYLFEIRRDERTQPVHHREVASDAELIILVHPGTPEQRIMRHPGVGSTTVRL